MNHDISDMSSGDDSFRELLAPLRSLAPDPKAQAANRRAVTAELSRMPAPSVSGASRLRRGAGLLAVIACTLVAGIGVGWTARGAANGADQLKAANDEQTIPPLTDVKRNDELIEEPASLAFYASETYVCGIGRIRSSSGYRFQE